MISRYLTLVVFLAFFLAFTQTAKNQERGYHLIVDYSSDTPNRSWIDNIIKSNYKDSLEVIEALENLRSKFYGKGFLAAGFDKITLSDSTFNTFFHSGIPYKWGKINVPEQYPPNFPRLPKSLRGRSGKTLSISEGEKIREDLIRLYENNGYPFAYATYDSLIIRDSIVEASVKVEGGPYILIDTLVNRSENVVSKRVLEQIVGLKKGQPYSEKKIVKAGKQIQNSTLIQMSRPLEVGFTDDKAWVYLSPKKKMANSFDGIIGLVPGGEGKAGLSLTGSLDLKLTNLFKQAEAIGIMWKAPGNQNQQLKAGFNVPYLLGSPVGFTSSLDLYKKDTSYLSTDWAIGITAALNPQSRIGFYVRQKASNVLLKLPNPLLSDIGVKLYGINMLFEKLENPLNPRKGLSFDSDLAVGNKILNKKLTEDVSTVYWEAKSIVDIYIPLGTYWVVNVGGRGAYLKGGQVFDNERFKIGGIYSLRGFDEESILADSYIMGTVELRYLFTKNSNFHLFTDGGSWWSKTNNLNRKGNPLGFGLGVSLDTRAGIVLLDYALGLSEDIPLNLRNGKIHLGIKSLF